MHRGQKFGNKTINFIYINQYQINPVEEKISVELFSDVGMDEQFMSRLFDLSNSVINGLFIKNQKEVKDALFTVIFD